MRTIFLRESGQQWWSHLDLFYLSFVRIKRLSPKIYKPAKLSWLLWLSLSLCLELHSVSVSLGFFFSLKKMKNGLQRDINQGAHCWPVFKDSYWDLTVTSWNGEMAKSACASLMFFFIHFSFLDFIFSVGPKSDHCLPLSVTDWRSWDLIYVALVAEGTGSKLMLLLMLRLALKKVLFGGKLEMFGPSLELACL